MTINERNEADWNQAWLAMFAPGGPLNTETEAAARSYVLFDYLGLGVLLNPERAEAMIEEARILGANLQSVIIIVGAGATGAGTAALFPDIKVRVVQADKTDELVDALLSSMPEHVAEHLNRPGGLRDKLKGRPRG